MDASSIATAYILEPTSRSCSASYISLPDAMLLWTLVSIRPCPQEESKHVVPYFSTEYRATTGRKSQYARYHRNYIRDKPVQEENPKPTLPPKWKFL